MDKRHEAACRVMQICRRLYERGLLSAADGNVSVRLGPDEIMITPSGVPKCSIEPGEMALLTLKGKILEGCPSSEKWLHLAVYSRCRRAQAVVHAHPPVATAWSIARPDLKELPAGCLSELIPASGGVPFVPYARPGTKKMGENLMPFLPRHRALILSHHGALTWGESLDEAFNGMERIEHSALILKAAADLGGLNSLSAAEVSALRALRRKIGERLI